MDRTARSRWFQSLQASPPLLTFPFGAKNIQAKAVDFMKMKAQILIAAVAIAFTAGLIAHATPPVGDAIDPWGNSYKIDFPAKGRLIGTISISGQDVIFDPWGNPYEIHLSGKEAMIGDASISTEKLVFDPWGNPYKIIFPGKSR